MSELTVKPIPLSAARLLSAARPDAPALPPQIHVDTLDHGVRIEEKVDKRETVTGLDALVKDGTIRSYTRHHDAIIAWADTPEAAAKMAALPRKSNPVVEGSVLDRARQLLVPPNMDDSVAPEYLRFRAWSLAGSVIGGAIGFMGASVNLDAMKIAFATGANAAMAGFANGLVYKASAMGSSYLARRGDADPKRWLMASTLVNATNSLITVGLLAVAPQAYVPLNTYLSVSGAVSNTIGGAANINVFNHLARGDNKGVVQAKNSNQDMLADALGMPLALGVSAAAHALGFNPYLATVGVLGPALAFCNLQAARALNIESVTRPAMNRIAESLLQTGTVPGAPRPTLSESIRTLFKGRDNSPEPGLRYTDSLDEVVKAANEGGGSADQLFGLFSGEAYIMATRKDADGHDEIVTAVRDNATFQDVLKATAHARMLRRILDSKLSGMLLSPDRTLLVELAKRGLPTIPDTDTVASMGWHTNLHALDLPRVEGGWSGRDPQRVKAIPTQNLEALITSPSADALEALMQPAQPSSQPV